MQILHLPVKINDRIMIKITRFKQGSQRAVNYYALWWEAVQILQIQREERFSVD